MWLFRKKTEKDREREIREEERKIADRRLLEVEKKHQDEKLMIVKDYGAKLVSEREQLIKEKKEEVKAVEDRLQMILDEHDQFTNERNKLQVIITEFSSKGIGIENVLVGLTRQFHILKSAVDEVQRSADKKEVRYQIIKERVS
jgi:hypothetical protein